MWTGLTMYGVSVVLTTSFPPSEFLPSEMSAAKEVKDIIVDACTGECSGAGIRGARNGY